MNYSKIYNHFIENRKYRTPAGYFEKHHIVPKSLGGLDDDSNMIKLSASDHLFAHGLLARVHGGKMIYALRRMLNGQQKRYTSKSERLHYDFVRKNFKHSDEAKAKMSISQRNKAPMPDSIKNKISLAMVGRHVSVETREKLSISSRGNTNSRGIVHSAQSRKNMSEARIGMKFSDEHKLKLSEAKKGKPSPRKGVKLSKETIDKMSKSLKGRTPWNKGLVGVSDETRLKMSESAKNRKTKSL